jgi:hypothetical protein
MKLTSAITDYNYWLLPISTTLLAITDYITTILFGKLRYILIKVHDEAVLYLPVFLH